MSQISLGELEKYWRETAAPDIEYIDLEDKIRAINPNYFNASYIANKYRTRFTEISFMKTEKRKYVILSGTYVFWSDDDFRTINEVQEINYFNGSLVTTAQQTIGSIKESMAGTIVTIGIDTRGGATTGVIWRKARGASAFTRATTNVWTTMPNTNVTLEVGFFGANKNEMLAFVQYNTLNLMYSLDDGVTWRLQSFGTYFNYHCHECYLSDKTSSSANGRLWVTGGDDFNGKGGIIVLDTLNDDNTLGGIKQPFNEMPGYRIVGVSGNGRKIFFGNEASACGMLAISEDTISIDNKRWEYVMGRTRFNFHQFDSICATDDGFLLSGADAYEGQAPHRGQGGYLYLSRDEGATFVEIPLGGFWVNGMDYDGDNFWMIVNGSVHLAESYFKNNCRLLKLRKPSPFIDLSTSYIAKSIYVDNGNATLPPTLTASQKSMLVDMSEYKSIALDIETTVAGTVVVEGCPFWTDPAWHPTGNGDIDGWVDVATITFTAAQRKVTMLTEAATHNKLFRIRNGSGSSSIGFKHAIFIGKK